MKLSSSKLVARWSIPLIHRLTAPPYISPASFWIVSRSWLATTKSEQMVWLLLDSPWGYPGRSSSRFPNHSSTRMMPSEARLLLYINRRTSSDSWGDRGRVGDSKMRRTKGLLRIGLPIAICFPCNVQASAGHCGKNMSRFPQISFNHTVPYSWRRLWWR